MTEDPRDKARKRMNDKKRRETGEKIKDCAVKGTVMGAAGAATNAAINGAPAVLAAAASASVPLGASAAALAAPTIAPLAAGSLTMGTTAMFAAPVAATGIGLPVAAAMLGGAAIAGFFASRHRKEVSDD